MAMRFIVNTSSSSTSAIPTSEKGQPLGVAPLDEEAFVPLFRLREQPIIIPIQSGIQAPGISELGQWTNMPSNATELFGNTNFRTSIDLTNYRYIRLLAQVLTVGATGSRIFVQYSISTSAKNGGGFWQTIDGSTGGTNTPITALGLAMSSWAAIDILARREDVYLRIAGIGGNGTADPVFGKIEIQVK